MDYSTLVESIVDSLLSEALYDNETKADRGSDRRGELADMIRTSRNEPDIYVGPDANMKISGGMAHRVTRHLDEPGSWLSKAQDDIIDRETHFDHMTRREAEDAEEYGGGFNDGWAHTHDDADIAHLTKAKGYASRKLNRSINKAVGL